MSRLGPKERARDRNLGVDPNRVNFFELQAAASDPDGKTAFVPAAAPVPISGQMVIMHHHDPYSSLEACKHRSKRVFKVSNASSHDHIIAPRPQPATNPARHADGVVAPFATTLNTQSDREGAQREQLFSSARSLTPTRLRGTPSPSRSRGYVQRNGSSADSPFSPHPQASERGQREVSERHRARAVTPPRHPITGEGCESSTRRTRAPGQRVAAASANPVSHDSAAPVASELLCRETQRPISTRKKHSAASQEDHQADRDRVFGDGPCPETARAQARASKKMVTPKSTFNPHTHDGPPEPRQASPPPPPLLFSFSLPFLPSLPFFSSL